MSTDHQAKFCTAVYKRLQAVQSYDASDLPPLRTPITLLKPNQPTLRAVPEDYLLSKVSNRNPEHSKTNGLCLQKEAFNKKLYIS